MPVSQQVWAVVWGLGLGLVFLAVIWVAVRSGWFRRATDGHIPEQDVSPEPVCPVHEYPDGLAEGHGNVPLLLKVVIAGYVVFLVGYIVLAFRGM